MNANFGGYGKIKITVAPGTTATWIVTHTDGSVVNVELHEGVNLIDNYGTVNTFTFLQETAKNILYADFAGLRVLNARTLFYQCNNITEIKNIDTTGVTDFYYTFSGCYKLVRVDRVDVTVSNLITWQTFRALDLLQFVGIVGFGGVQNGNINIDFTTNYAITRECLLFMLDNAVDRRAKGWTTDVILILNSSVYNRLTAEDLPLFEAKGITIKKV